MKYFVSLLFTFIAISAQAQEQNSTIEAAKPNYKNTVSVYYGRRAAHWFTSVISNPFGVEYVDEEIVTAAYSRELWDLGSGFSLELEGFIALHAYEGNFAEFGGNFFLRFENFPWNDYVRTSFAISPLGPSYVTKIPEWEKKLNPSKTGSSFLNSLMPEITLGLPKYPEWDLLFRIHHRSGVFGLISDVNGGSNFVSVGLKRNF